MGEDPEEARRTGLHKVRHLLLSLELLPCRPLNSAVAERSGPPREPVGTPGPAGGGEGLSRSHQGQGQLKTYPLLAPAASSGPFPGGLMVTRASDTPLFPGYLVSGSQSDLPRPLAP